jgi:hypothetical protein
MFYIEKHVLAKGLIALTGFANLALATGFAINSNPAMAQTVTASTYQSSCNTINIGSSLDTITARCLRTDLSFNNTSIQFKGISNNDGVLVFSSLNNPSSFQFSCTTAFIAGNTLVADCRRIDGTYNKTSILIPGIRNNNGVLSY